MLVHGGIEWPWTEELLVPANPVFRSPELPQDQPVIVGRSDDKILFRVGDWSIWLVVEKDARFPRVEDIVHRPDTATATLTISAADAKFLTASLPQLPTDDVLHHPVTVDLNGHVAVRAKPVDKETTTELVLASSEYSGQPIRVNTNRHFLLKALRLGFSTISVFGDDTPIQCQDGTRTLLWCLLDPKLAYAPSADSVRIEPKSPSVSSTPSSTPSLPRNRITMIAKSQSSSDSIHSEKSSAVATPISPTKSESASPIEQAVALRAALRDTLSKTNNLIRALRRQKQQSRLVQATLASLRQL